MEEYNAIDKWGDQLSRSESVTRWKSEDNEVNKKDDHIRVGKAEKGGVSRVGEDETRRLELKSKEQDNLNSSSFIFFIIFFCLYVRNAITIV